MNPQTVHGETLAEAIVANLDIESLPIFRAEGVTVEMGDYEWSNGHLLGIVVGEERFTLSLTKVDDRAGAPTPTPREALIRSYLAGKTQATASEVSDHLKAAHGIDCSSKMAAHLLRRIGWHPSKVAVDGGALVLYRAPTDSVPS